MTSFDNNLGVVGVQVVHFCFFTIYYLHLLCRLQKQAIDVAKRYRANGFAASEDAAFFLLLDLMTFFDLFHSKKIDEALDIISKIKVFLRIFKYNSFSFSLPFRLLVLDLKSDSN